jgi:hypothetical protein
VTQARCNSIVWCSGMTEALSETKEFNGEGKGLQVGYGITMEEGGKPRRLWVVYRQKARFPGVVLNYCPWCQAWIRFDVVEGMGRHLRSGPSNFVEAAATLVIAACERWYVNEHGSYAIEAWQKSVAVLQRAMRLAGRDRELDTALALAREAETYEEVAERTLSGIGP